MTENSLQQHETNKLVLILLILVVFLVVLFAPFAYHVDLGPGPHSIEAVMWQYIESSWYVGFRFRDPLRYFAYIVVRLIFILQFLRYKLAKSSRKTTLLVVAYSEVHVGLLSLPVFMSWYFGLGIFLSSGGDPIEPIFFPIPILSILVAILVYIDKRRY